MAGYANRLISLHFDEWSEDPNDPIWISIRNPKLQPPDMLQPRAVPLDENGQPIDPEQAKQAMYETIAKLVVAWRVYDPTVVDVDPATNLPVDQPLLPLPATPQTVAKLPIEFISRIAEHVKEAANPSR